MRARTCSVFTSRDCRALCGRRGVRVRGECTCGLPRALSLACAASERRCVAELALLGRALPGRCGRNASGGVGRMEPPMMGRWLEAEAGRAVGVIRATIMVVHGAAVTWGARVSRHARRGDAWGGSTKNGQVLRGVLNCVRATLRSVIEIFFGE